MRRWRMWSVVLLAFLGACAAWDQRMVPIPDLETGPLRSTQFPDVPVPAGLVLLLDRGESASVQNGGFRWADLRYQGQARLGESAAFLRDQLPYFQWRIAQDESPKTGEWVIRAIKASEELLYRFRQGDQALRMRIVLRPAESSPYSADSVD